MKEYSIASCKPTLSPALNHKTLNRYGKAFFSAMILR